MYEVHYMKRCPFFFLLCIMCMLFIPVTTCMGENVVSTTFSFVENTAYIGQPFTVNYEISGGSGAYTNIFIIAHSVTEMCVIDIYQEEVFVSKGSFSFVPVSGETLKFSLVCTDAVTSKKWESRSEPIKCEPNPHLPITIENLPSTCYIDHEFSFTYYINSLNPISQVTISYWVFVEDDIYPDKLFEQTSSFLSGSSSYIPQIGHSLYIAIQGTDISGNPFYLKTNRITIKGPESITPISASFAYEQKNAQIGSPFSVNYEISGGSGAYTDIFVIAHSVTEMCVIDIYQEEVFVSKGSFSFVPVSGETLKFSLVCTDAVTSKKWEFRSEPIKCEPNPNLTVFIEKIPPDYCINQESSFTYRIDSLSPIANATISYWVFVEDDIYPDKLFEQTISSLNGTSSFIPKLGHSLYIAIQGKNTNGIPFYVKTDRISINNQLNLSNCLFLPSSLQRIESQAFALVDATKVFIPDSVIFIAEDAFYNSSIRTILSTSSYAKEYATLHDLEFIQYNENE